MKTSRPPRTPWLPWLVSFLITLFWFGAATASELDRARGYWDDGELTAAVLVLKEHLNKAPDDVDARVLLASVYLDLYQADAAEKELVKAQSAGASRAQVAVPLSRALLLLGQYQRLLDEMAVATQSTPRAQAELSALRGDAHRGLGDISAARAEYDRALSIVPNQIDAQLGLARLALAAGDLDKANDMLEHAARQDPEAARAWELLGELRFARGDYAAAEEALVKAIIVGRNKWMPRFKRALTRLELGKVDAAAADIQAVADAFPTFPGLFFARGALALQQGDLATGLAALETYLKFDPGNFRALYLSAIGEMQRGNLDLAEDHLRKYLELLPDSVQANRAMAELLLERHNPAAAAELLRKALAATPDRPELLQSLARALARQGKWQDAQQPLDRLIELAPDSADYRVAAAENLHQLGQRDAALAQLEQALTLDPLQRTAPLMQVKILLEQQQHEAALALAKRLASARRDDPFALNALGLAQLGVGAEADARASFHAAIASEPAFPDAALNLAKLAIRDGDVAAARTLLEQIVSAAPGHIEATLALAELDESGDDLRSLEQRLRAAIEAYPDEDRFRLALAQAFLRNGMANEARMLVQSAPERMRREPELMLVLGQAQAAVGEHDLAIETLHALQLKAPGSATPGYLLTTIYAEQEHIPAMEDALLAAAAMAPDSPLLASALQRALEEYKDSTAQIALVDRLLAATNDAPPLIALKADLLLSQGSHGSAARLLRGLYARHPEDVGVMRKLVEVLRAGHASEDAVRVLEEWLARYPDDSVAKVMLAQVQVEAGRADAGRALLEGLFASDKSLQANPLILNNLAWLLRETDPQRALGYAERALRGDPGSPAIKDTLGILLVRHGDLRRGLRLLEEAARAEPADATIGFHYAEALAKADRDAEARVVLLNLMRRDFPERADAEALLRQLGG